MVDSSSSSPDTASAALSDQRSRWRYLLPLVWAALGARIAVALIRRESVRDDFLSLALVAFLMTSAVLGSRAWLWFHDHWERMSLGRRSHFGPPRART